MEKRYYFLISTLVCTFLHAERADSVHTLDNQQNTKTISDKKTPQKTIWFRYKDAPLVDLVNDMAKLRNINIMLPQGGTSLTAKVTFELPHKITVERAWQYMITLLDIAGFTIVARQDMSYVVRNDQNVTKEPLPLYVGVPPQDLPTSDLKIRYLRYLTYLQVPGAGGGQGSTGLQDIFTQILSSNSSVIYEPQLNAVLLIDNARNIKSAMTLVDELDASSMLEIPKFVKLHHTSSSQVKTLFDQLIPGQQSSNSGFGGSSSPAPGPEGGYFTKGTRIVSEDRLNMLILLGKKDALDRIEEFIKQYVDIPPENGESILHIYDLQYLNAQNFAPILQNIVQNQQSNSSNFGGGGYGSGTGQSTSSGGGGWQQYFKGVIITTEGSGGGSGYTSSGSGSSTSGMQTGNRLIIAALRDDWIRIKKLIKELDTPQEQVLITGLIVDLSHTGLKDFANQIRNYKDLFLQDVNWQTAHINGIENESGTPGANPTNSNALMANLLPSGNNSSVYSTNGNIASNATAGTFIMSFKDPGTNGIWLVSTLLSQRTDTKILSQPYLTAMNNTQVTFSNTEQRRIPGQASEKFGVEVAAQEDVNASISLTLTPNINSNGSINLTVNAQISEFGAQNSRTTRNVTTNVNLKNKDILVTGGLSKTKVEHTVYKTPFFGDIPIVGNLFKHKKKTTTKSNLMLFLRVEIIKPFDTAFMNRFYQKADTLLQSGEENFSALRDPVSRWFFGKDVVNPELIQNLKKPGPQINLKQIYKTEVPMPAAKKPNRNDTKTAQTQEPFSPKVLEKPSERPPVNQEQEELQAEAELKKLFGITDQTATQQELTKLEAPLQQEETIIQEQEKNDLTINSQVTEEQQAEDELKTLFKTTPVNFPTEQ